MEEKIPSGAIAIGKAIKDLNFPEHCVLAVIFRSSEVVVPHGNTIFEVEDEVLAITDRQGVEQFQKLFSGL